MWPCSPSFHIVLDSIGSPPQRTILSAKGNRRDALLKRERGQISSRLHTSFVFGQFMQAENTPLSLQILRQRRRWVASFGVFRHEISGGFFFFWGGCPTVQGVQAFQHNTLKPTQVCKMTLHSSTLGRGVGPFLPSGSFCSLTEVTVRKRLGTQDPKELLSGNVRFFFP